MLHRYARSIGGYQPTQASLRTWLYEIAANKLVDFYRSRSRQLTIIPLDLEIAQPFADDDLQKRMVDRVFAQAVNQLVATLPANTQSIFRLHIWAEHSFREIAQSLQMPENTVRTKYYRLISLLRKEFSDYGQ